MLETIKQQWLVAKASNDSNARYCTLATVSAKGQPSLRTLVLRDITHEGFVIYINETSKKYQDIAANSQLELLLFWPTLMQQFRIRGVIKEISDTQMEQHWQHKPYESKLLDHYYAHYQGQSTAINQDNALQQGIESLKQRYPTAQSIPYVANAKGWVIQANYIEDWRGSNDNLHNRVLYTCNDQGKWTSQSLVP